jgi:hypothetical protein
MAESLKNQRYMPTPRTGGGSTASQRLACVFLLPVLALVASAVGTPARAQPAQAPTAKGTSRSGQDDLGEIGRKLANPVSDVWALFTEFDLFFSDGDDNLGEPEVGGRMIFQPIIPFPLYGSGDKAWKLITRPNVPIVFSQPIATGFNDFKQVGGLGDIQLLTHFAPPAGNWLIGAGPCWLFPTSTNDALGRQQWGIGPSGVVGYKAKQFMAAVVPQYYFSIGSRRDRGNDVQDASYLNLLYFFPLGAGRRLADRNQPDHHLRPPGDVGQPLERPDRADGREDDADRPPPGEVRVRRGVLRREPEDFGQRFQFKLNIIPVIPSLVQKPILGE